jgi:YegS/Rv2252/BmrU family lipid kinase
VKETIDYKVYAIINPAAGSSNPDLIESKLRSRLGAQLIDVHRTSKGDDFRVVVQKAIGSGANVILAAGGDGTLSQVASHLVGTSILFFAFPAGTANILAKSLGIPTDIDDALNLLEHGQPIQIDAIKIGRSHFFSHLSVGVYSNIAKHTPPAAKRRFGRIAYIWSAFKILSGEKNWTFNLRIDGKDVRLKASTIMLANIGDIGSGSLQWGPDVSPNDAVLNLCIIRSKTWQHYVKLVWEYLRYKDCAPTQTKHFIVRDTLEVHANKPLPVRGDGEILGNTPILIKVKPSALTLFAPLPIKSINGIQ